MIYFYNIDINFFQKSLINFLKKASRIITKVILCIPEQNIFFLSLKLCNFI